MQFTVDLWLWRITDPVSRRNYVTRYRMTEPDARHIDPAAQRVEGSLERRTVWIDPNLADWVTGDIDQGQGSGVSRSPQT